MNNLDKLKEENLKKLRVKVGLGIYNLRNEQGFSRQEFADMAEISLNSLSSIENGKSLIKIDTLQNLLNSLSIKLNDFFREIEL